MLVYINIMFHILKQSNDCVIPVQGKADGPRGLYENWDFDLNGIITIEEVRIALIYFLTKNTAPFDAE